MRIAQWWLVLFILLPLAACHSYDNKDYAAMNELPMQTMCVGRMLVDLPKGKQSWQQQFDYAKVSKLSASVNTKEAFDAQVKKRKTKLDQPTRINPDGRLGFYKEVNNNFTIMQFRPRNDDHLGYATERYLWLGNWGYKYKTEGVFNDEAAVLLSRIKEIPDHVLPIQNTNPPDESGFCIDSALVTGDIGPIDSSIIIDTEQWPGVWVHAGSGEDDGSREPLPWQKPRNHQLPTAFEDLKMKQDAAKDDEKVQSFDVLRKREKKLAGLTGQEVLIKETLKSGQKYYDFSWEVSASEDLPNKTTFGMHLTAGDNRNSSDYKAPPEQDKLLALWDAMLASLERRSGARYVSR